MELDQQTAVLAERATNPNSKEYRELMSVLLRPRDDGRTRSQVLNDKAPFRYTLPYKGDAEVEDEVSALTSFKFSDRAHYRNGVASLALSAAELIDLVVLASNRKRSTATLVVSSECESLYDIVSSAGNVSTLVYYCGYTNLADIVVTMSDKLETMVFDHTTVNVPVDELLNFAFKAGVRVVDGVFPYHVAATRGWDVVAGVGRWSFTHAAGEISVGPDDDSTRLMRYRRTQYLKFLEPSTWEGKSRQYVYEIRKFNNGLATYRAVYVGDKMGGVKPDLLSFKMPMCSSEDMVLITINKSLASGCLHRGPIMCKS